MPLPRISPPKVIWADLRAFLKDRTRHQWGAAILAILIPIGIVWLFIVDARTNIAPGEQLIYVDSWKADRTDAEIKAAQTEREQAEAEAALERQRAFQRLEKRLGMDD